MKKSLVCILAAALLAAAMPLCAPAEGLSVASAIVHEPFSSTVLFEKQADERMLVASTTKMLTAMVVLENCALEEKVTVTAEHAAVEGSSMYLRPGGDYSVEDLLYGLMLASGNDAAAALADHAAGSMEAFAELMNASCAEMGLENSHFVNSHGLDHPEHYSSARDLALICAEAMKNPVFCRIFATENYKCGGRSYRNHNKLLASCPGCIGGKTGYTEKAGRILVSCAERDGMRLICVTVSDPRDWEDHNALYDRFFEEYEYILPELPEGIPVISGTAAEAGLKAAESGFVVKKSENAKLSLHLPDYVFAPVKAGDKAGTAELMIPGGESRSMDIFYADTVFVDSSLRLTSWERFRNIWRSAAGIGVYVPEGRANNFDG